MNECLSVSIDGRMILTEQMRFPCADVLQLLPKHVTPNSIPVEVVVPKGDGNSRFRAVSYTSTGPGKLMLQLCKVWVVD